MKKRRGTNWSKNWEERSEFSDDCSVSLVVNHSRAKSFYGALENRMRAFQVGID